MRIAQIAPLIESVPPRLYGGTERVVAYLADALVELGHEVTLFASGDSRTRARLVPCSRAALRLDSVPRDPLLHAVLQLEAVRRHADRFDVLHFHTDYLHFPLFQDMTERTVTTLHGRLDLPDLPPLFQAFRDVALVSISHDQRRPVPPVRWLATVHHGLPRHRLPFTPNPKGGYLAFLGRIAPEKGPDLAIEIARRAGVPLKIFAKIDPANERYFHERIAPMLDHPLIEFVGEIDEASKSRALGDARALLFPIDWPEPFGLVLIEAMACGTPVIAYRRGSVPEILEHGRTGLIVDGIEEAADAVRKVHRLDRWAIRRCFEEQFTAERMARAYVAAYQRLRALPRPQRVA